MAPLALSPHLTLEPVTDATITEWMDLTNHVFSLPQPNGDPSFLSVFYPDGITPEISAWTTATHAASLPKPTEHYAIIRATQSYSPAVPAGTIIATARWVDIPASTPESRAAADVEAAAQREKDALNPVPGVDYRVYDLFRPAQLGGQARVVGDRAHTYLKILAVAPGQQGKGVGSAVLRHVCAEAAREGKPVFLESSPMGVPVYAKAGFLDRGFIDFDARQLGGECAHKFLAMVWEPEGRV